MSMMNGWDYKFCLQQRTFYQVESWNYQSELQCNESNPLVGGLWCAVSGEIHRRQLGTSHQWHFIFWYFLPFQHVHFEWNSMNDDSSIGKDWESDVWISVWTAHKQKIRRGKSVVDWISPRFDSESSPLVQTSWTSFVTCELPCDCHRVRDMNRIRTYIHDEYNSSYWIRIEFQHIFPLCDFVDTASRCNISII